MTILVVAAHPDDEILGCGGTMAKLVAMGMKVEVMLMSGGRDKGTGSLGPNNMAKAAKLAAFSLGVEAPYVSGHLSDNRFDERPLLVLVQMIETCIDEVQPDMVVTHHSGDLNIDHRMTHQAVLTACRPVPGQCVKSILGFEVLSSTEWGLEPFNPVHFVDISAHLDDKCRALGCYESEMRKAPHARSIENVRALATMRGHSVGVMAAEAFTVIRQIT